MPLIKTQRLTAHQPSRKKCKLRTWIFCSQLLLMDLSEERGKDYSHIFMNIEIEVQNLNFSRPRGCAASHLKLNY